MIAFEDGRLTVYQDDARTVLRELEAGSVHAVVTSPPYWQQRTYLDQGTDGKPAEIGLERTFEEWLETMLELGEEIRRVLVPGGSYWLNVGDRYKAWGGQHVDPALAGKTRAGMSGFPKGLKRKSLLLAPYRLAIAMTEAGWILRDEIIWAKSNGIPESVRDRFSRRHEVLFRFTKTRYDDFDLSAVRVDHKPSTLERTARGPASFGGHGAKIGAPKNVRSRSGKEYVIAGKGPGPKAAELEDRGSSIVDSRNGVYRYKRRLLSTEGVNPGNVWTMSTASREAAHYGHFAMFPRELVVRPILTTVPEGGVVLDPFAGTGTVGDVANRLGRRAILVELNPESVDEILRRTAREELEPIAWSTLGLAPDELETPLTLWKEADR